MKLVSFAFAGVDPEIMGIGPIPATEKALRKAGLTIDDIDLFEMNEAFAVQVLSFLDHYGIADDDPRVNPWGGAIAVGHPLASSGVRLMNQLASQFTERPDVRYGITSMCVGLGQGGTMIWENPNFDKKAKKADDRLLDHRLRLARRPRGRRRGRHALVRARHPPVRRARRSRSSPSTTGATTRARTRSARPRCSSTRRCSTS